MASTQTPIIPVNVKKIACIGAGYVGGPSKSLLSLATHAQRKERDDTRSTSAISSREECSTTRPLGS
ncbi:hypothetical protein BCR35DRAFT_10215 [Leucosporidium creatinivorum]|uniref:UDP-glucose/GDP-mannose dehydrogenase N-terminal domain-containing protein n=1 Tax=Leucosporidium creatinivorum TaxID=106004 RepID=A0A1Y2G4L6_9BASI|nr:hypothetical protein BCR35DRAFT_10215 [Leucosporidium creatinivorum]